MGRSISIENLSVVFVGVEAVRCEMKIQRRENRARLWGLWKSIVRSYCELGFWSSAGERCREGEQKEVN